jgi:hypothetical protein
MTSFQYFYLKRYFSGPVRMRRDFDSLFKTVAASDFQILSEEKKLPRC